MRRIPDWAIALLILIGMALIIWSLVIRNRNNSNNSPATSENNPTSVKPQVVDPIDRSDERVTKKPFGIYITPKTSPVQPEKFTGFHTGTDFETFPEEANTDVPFRAICEGKVLDKRTASGYGGVFVQSCTINGEAVTVVYGHVKLSSISKNIGNDLTQGEQIGFLGQPPTETDGERKHLHLGVHKGSDENIAGYVQADTDLSNWLDFKKI